MKPLRRVRSPLHRRCALRPRAILAGLGDGAPVMRLVGREFVPIELPACDPLGAAIGDVAALRIEPDDDRNGVIDISGIAQLPNGTERAVTWFGGVGAPCSTRCALSR